MSKKYAKIDENKCIGCGACVKKCKKGALSMGPDGYPVVDRALCTGCGKCMKVCPAECIKIKKDKDDSKKKEKKDKKDKDKKKAKKKKKKSEAALHASYAACHYSLPISACARLDGYIPKC